jgi:hypothetical protein
MLNAPDGAERTDFESPQITDYGSLMDITQACFGTGGEDGGSKANGNPFVNSAPYFGDSNSFCQ